MGEWNYKKLEEVCDVRDGTHDSPKYHETGIPFITSKNLSPSGIDFTDISFISKENHKQFSQRSKVDKGDILFGMIGTVGNPVLINFDLEFSIKNVALLKFGQSKELFNEFAIQVLKSNIILDQFRSKSDGGVQAFVSLTTIRNLDFPVPLISEQRQIATILSTADAVIEKTQAAIAKYKAIKQGMLQDLFTRGIDTTTGKLRPSYQDAPELYKECKLGWIPREWSEERLGNRALIEYGKSQKAVVSINGNIPVYGTGGLMEYATDFLFDGESILIGRKGTIDKPFYINGKFWTVDTAYYLSAFSGNVRWLHSQLEFYNLKRLNEATGVPSINRELLYNIQLSFPDKTEQDEIVKRILSIDKKIQTEQDFLHKQQHIKAGLMNDLLSGKRKVKSEKLEKEVKN